MAALWAGDCGFHERRDFDGCLPNYRILLPLGRTDFLNEQMSGKQEGTVDTELPGSGRNVTVSTPTAETQHKPRYHPTAQFIPISMYRLDPRPTIAIQ